MLHANSVKLPNEAVKSVLACMSRKELIVLSMLNRQFAHIMHSPPLTAKPLLGINWIDFRQHHRNNEGARIGFVLHLPHLHFCTVKRGVVNLDSVLYTEWLRLKVILIRLPQDNEVGRAWLESLYDNSHCLVGCKGLYVRTDNGTVAPEISELIDKLRPLVGDMMIY